MTTAMNEAEKLAELLLKSPGSGQVTGYLDDAAALLRRQAEQIKELRLALEVISRRCPTSHPVYTIASVGDTARFALAATKEAE